VSGTGAGIQEYQELLDPGFRRGDGSEEFFAKPTRIIGMKEGLFLKLSG